MRQLTPIQFGTLVSSCLRGLMLVLCCTIGFGGSLRSLLSGNELGFRVPWCTSPGPTAESPAEESPAESTPVEELEIEEFTSGAVQVASKRHLVSTRVSWLPATRQVTTRRGTLDVSRGAHSNRNGCGSLLRC